MLEELWKKGHEFLGSKYPIISGGMTWISDFRMVKAVADNGAFPVLAGGNMPPELFESEIDRCINEIDGPFAANLITIAPNFKVHSEIVKSKNVPFVVFAGNFPKRADVEGMKKAGKKTLCFASTESIANQMIRFGIDGLLLEGSEAGGHIGHVSLAILLQQVLFKFRDFPIFVAGGLGTGEMVAHLLLMGAWGCQFGTLFVMTDECPAHPAFKQAFIKARARQAVATPRYDSKLPVVPVRAIYNKSMVEFGELQLEILQKLKAGEIDREKAQFEVESYWVGSLRSAVIDGDVEGGSMMAGQSVGLMNEIKPMKKLIADLMQDAEDELQRVKGLIAGL